MASDWEEMKPKKEIIEGQIFKLEKIHELHCYFIISLLNKIK